MKKTYLYTVALCFMLFEGAVSAKTLSQSLSDYCVPKTSEYCSNAWAAKYNATKNACDCKNTTYMRYDSNERHCVIQCPAGSIPVQVTSCPAGSQRLMIVDHS